MIWRIGALAAAAAVWAPATGHAADRCQAHDHLPRYTARASAGFDWYRTPSAARVCDHRTGRERVLRRGLVRRREPDATQPQGRLIGDASAAGGWVAWIEAVYVRRPGRRHYRVTAYVVVARASTGRILRRFAVLRRADDDDPFSVESEGPRMGVALTARRRLAWLVAGTVLLERPGRRPAVLARGVMEPLDIEDGRTLLWSTGREVAYHDLEPPRTRDGCPVRERFRPLITSPDVLVTIASYRRTEEDVLRACLRSRGDDPPIGQAARFESEGSSIQGVTAGYGRVAFDLFTSNRYGYCEDHIVVVDLLTLARTTDHREPCTAFRNGPERRGPFVLTSRGVPAWFSPAQARHPDSVPPRLLTVEDGRRLVELDRGGGLHDLRADGEEIAWSNVGDARRARP